MPTIAQRLITSPRVTRRCAICEKYVQGPVWRKYGYGCEGDPPYVMWVCPECHAARERAVRAARELEKQPQQSAK